MLREDLNSLCTIVKDYIPASVIAKKNKANAWAYGYNQEYDVVIISKTGKIGDIINISGLYIALPEKPSKIWSRSSKASEQYWEREELPKE